MKQFISSQKSFLNQVVLFCIVLLYSSSNLLGSHAMGADLTYEHIGGNNYKVKLTFYRDCNGISAPVNPTIGVSSLSCGQQTTTYSMNLVSWIEVSMLCSSVIPNSTCNGGSVQGVEEYVYESVINLANPCADWVISYSVCCRNAAVTNSQNPQAYDMYIETHLDNLNAPENNSPIFVNLPIFYACSGQPVIYSPGAVDLEGDSLAYYLVDPLDNSTTNIPYNPPYSSIYPLSTSPPNTFLFDSIAGQMIFTPDGAQIGIVTLVVEEYRNGVKIGSIPRDMQIVVLGSCTNSSPQITPPTVVTGGTMNGNFITTLTGQNLSFPILASDPDIGDSLIITSNISTFPGATLSITGVNPVTMNFDWNSTGIMGNYPLVVQVSDNGCPVTYDQSISLVISVLGVEATASPQTICEDTTTLVQLNADLSGLNPGGTYIWTPTTGLNNPQIPNPIASVNSPITYTVSYTIGTSTATATVYIGYNGDLTVSPPADTICKGSGVQLNAIFQEVNPTLTPCDIYIPGCLGSTSSLSIGTDSTETGPTTSSGEAGTPFLGYFEDGRWQAIYKASELHALGFTEGLITELALNVSAKNSSLPYNGFSISLGCTPSGFDTNSPAFLGNTTLVYTNSVSTTLGWNTFAFSNAYYWNGIDDLLIQICYDNSNYSTYDHVFYSATPDTSVLYQRLDNEIGCSINSVIISNRRANIQLTTCQGPTTGPSFTWTPSTGLDNPNIQNPVASPTTTTTYTLTVDNGTCSFSELVTITVTDGVQFTLNSVNPGCGMSDGSIAATVTLGAPPFTYVWSDPSIGNTANATGLSDGTYTVTITDDEGCAETGSSTLSSTLSTAPTDLVFSNPAACIGDTVSLMAVGGTAGPGASLVYYEGSCGGTVVPDPTNVVISSSGAYYVRYEDSCGVTACAMAGTSCFNFTLRVAAVVEGPYDLNTGLMRDELRVSGLLPYTEPYSALGYQHVGGGNESTVASVFSVSGPNAITDWVFVELRSVSDYTTAVATRSALLQTDGDVVDVDGVSAVDFAGSGVPAGDYWIVIRHRSHVDAMSAGTVYIGGANQATYDFASLGAFGNGINTLDNGVMVLHDGDINQDGKVNSADRSAIWNARNQTGYIPEDITLNGYCGADDRSESWNSRNIESQVP